MVDIATSTLRSSLLRHREFRGLTAAQITSECGDQIAAIALSYLVYERSHSPFLAAASFAANCLAVGMGGIVLAPLVDWLPRRRLMLACDAVRCALIALLAGLTRVPGVPIGALVGVVFAVSLFSPLFGSARSSLIADVLPDRPQYLRGVTAGRIIQQVDLVFGFVAGGLIVAAVSPFGALIIDAGSFAASFVLIATHVHPRPPAQAGTSPTVSSVLRAVAPGVRLVLADPVRRALLMLAVGLLLFWIAPEALAIAYARQHGHGAVAAGILLAAQPCGVAIGSWIFVRHLHPRYQARWLLPLACAPAVLLTLTATHPPVWLAAVLWFTAGLLECQMAAIIAAYNVVTDPAIRGRANGLAAAGIATSQGLGFLIWGAIGAWSNAGSGVAIAGLVGLLIVAAAWSRWPAALINATWSKLASG